MELKLKKISASGIPEAIRKVELYRYLNEPEEAESICRDILAVEPEHQDALRLLGLCITDQFTGELSDRYAEVREIFVKLSGPYERAYYTGLLYERKAKAHMRKGAPLVSLKVWFEHAMRCFEDAEKILPAANDDALLRWNRCARLLEELPPEKEADTVELDVHDSPPVPTRAASK